MLWLTKLIAALLTIANDYAWYAVDPVAPFALAEANCPLLSYSCLAKAKSIHLQLVHDHTEHYWCKVKEEASRAEHARKEKEAHEREEAEQREKAERWDRWEMSPPSHTTIIKNYGDTYNYFDHPTFITQQCPSPPTEVPGIDEKALAVKHRPSIDAELKVNPRTMDTQLFLLFLNALTLLVALVVCFWFICIALAAAFRYVFRGPPPPPPPAARPPSPPPSGICSPYNVLCPS